MKRNDFKGNVSQDIMRQRIDVIDQKILYMLSTNCRISNTAIAKELKINREVVSYRIRQMMDNRLIMGFFTLINMRKLGLFTHMVYVKLKALESEKNIVRFLETHEQVTAVLTFSGRFDLYFEVSTKTLEEFDSFFNGFMKMHASAINEFIILNQLDEFFTGDKMVLDDFSDELVKDLSIVEAKGSSFQKEFMSRKTPSGGHPEVRIDAEDRKILECLHHDARASLKEISKKTDLTPNAVKARLSSLVENGVIECFKPIISFAALGYQWYMVLLNIRGEDERKFRSYLQFHKNVEWCIRCIGQWNYQISVFARDNREFHEVLNDLRERFSENLISFDSVLVFNQFRFEQKIN
jgi:Lrp/AsnC family leucine-responsive transcriptional regulator